MYVLLLNELENIKSKSLLHELAYLAIQDIFPSHYIQYKLYWLVYTNFISRARELN